MLCHVKNFQFQAQINSRCKEIQIRLFYLFIYLFCLFVLFPCITSKAPFPLKQERRGFFYFRFALFLLGLLGPPIDLLFLGPEDEKANIPISHIFRCTRAENFSSTVHVHEHVLKSTSVRLAFVVENIVQSKCAFFNYPTKKKIKFLIFYICTVRSLILAKRAKICLPI